MITIINFIVFRCHINLDFLKNLSFSKFFYIFYSIRLSQNPYNVGGTSSIPL